MARIKSMPRLRLMRGCGIGKGIHKLRASVRERVGAKMNSVIEVVRGRMGSFMNSFMASANGCRMPYGPTMLGPFRNCM